MQLICTPRSHFSRKVRLLLSALGIDIELIDAGNVGERSAGFGPNPLMKVPTLLDEGRVVFDSDHIAAYLARRHDPGDRWQVLTIDTDVLNARAVLNGVMGQEVELILAARSGIDTAAQPRYDKLREGMAQGLAWLEQRSELFADSPAYLGLHLVSLWDHLALYRLMALDYPRLRTIVERYSGLPWVAASRPV